MNPFGVCECCVDSVGELYDELRAIPWADAVADRVRADMASGAPDFQHVDGLVDMILHKPDELGEPGEELLGLLTAFLLVQREEEQRRHSYTDYVALYSFIYDCLKLPEHNDYNHLIMCYMDTHGILEHGSGIRCGWIAEEHETLLPSPAHRKVVYDWLATKK